jgi:hypothetical protein
MRGLPLIACALIALCRGSYAQIAPPKHETGAEHVRHSRAQNYSQRFEAAKCALVQIIREVPGGGASSYGTGFYISDDGDIVTASHVVGDRVWTDKEEGGVTVDLNAPDHFKVVENSGNTYNVPQTAIETNREAWGSDLAHIATGRKVKCWLSVGDDKKVKPGDLVITLGYPGLAFGSLTMYQGIVSASNLTSNLPVGLTTNTKREVMPTNSYTRVQMPISGGLSGAPVLNEENQAIAVVTNAGLWSETVDRLIGAVDNHQIPMLLQPPFVPQRDTVNMTWVLGVLAKSFHQYSSPGYGDCVPLGYLKMQKEKKAETLLPLGH